MPFHNSVVLKHNRKLKFEYVLLNCKPLLLLSSFSLLTLYILQRLICNVSWLY